MARHDPHNQTRYWRSRHIAGLTLLRADFTTHDYATHTHDGFVVAATEAGGAHVTNAGRAHAALPGSLFVSNPNEPQSARMGRSPRWRYRAFYLSHPAMDLLAHTNGARPAPFFIDGVLNDPALAARFLRLHHALETEHDRFRDDELLADAFGTLLLRNGGGSPRAPAYRDAAIVRAVVASMQAQHAEKLSLATLAAGAGLTPFQLIVLFKRTVGLTPHAYLIQIRLNVAREHLRRGSPLADSATAAGFYDQSALTRHFKRWYGITPRQYAAVAQ